MESLLHMKMRRVMAAAGGAAILAVTGCGGSGHYKSRDRPPATILVTAYISDNAVSVDPDRFGSGPVKLVVTNQSSAAQQVTFQGSGTAGRFKQQTAPINPRDVAELKADVLTGNAIVRVDGDGIKPARITITRRRPSAQNELLQP